MATTVEEKTFIRPDGKEKVTGAGRYTADVSLAGQLHARFLYSEHARARINGIDTSKAKALPGVLAVLTQEDVPDVRYGRSPRTGGCSPRTRCATRPTSSPPSRR